MSKCIALIGYMCAGKTIIGRDLAKAIGRRFYDLDWYIEERYHKKIAAMFEDEGEAYFRDIESRMLREVAAFEDIVLSCGGGTPCFMENMDFMNEVAETIYLKASPRTLCDHVKMSRGRRPLLEGKSPEELESYIAAQLEQRSPFYEQARHIINIDVLDSFSKINFVVNEIQRRLAAAEIATGFNG